MTLQTRLFPYFLGEGRRLRFAAAPAYLNLVKACYAVGALMILAALAVPGALPISAVWWFFVGCMVATAGLLATGSLPFVAFDLREGTYRLHLGAGPLGARRRGSIREFEALVVTAHRSLGASALSSGRALEFRLSLHWRGRALPPVLLALDYRTPAQGESSARAAGPMLELGRRTAAALRLPLYDDAATVR